jgi:multiple sugar transport system permease protein/trehalose/maltose transport system permease protein
MSAANQVSPSVFPSRFRAGTARTVFLRLGAILIVVWSVSPFLWQISTALQEDKKLVATTPSFLPDPLTFVHFYNIFVIKKFQVYLVNSIIVAGTATLLCTFFGTLTAFALARLRVRYRFGILGLILTVSMFPQIAIVGPLYLLASQLGLLDTYVSLIIVDLTLGLPLMIWVLFGYFSAIPREIDESAGIDGAGPFRTLWLITLPMSLPALVTTGLISFIAAWNEFMFALALTSDMRHQTVPVGIANFQSLYFVPWGDLSAASVVVTIPLHLMVLFFQRQIISGLTSGAVKE